METNELKTDDSRSGGCSRSGLGLLEKVALTTLAYSGWVMLILIGALVLLAIVPWLSLLIVTIGRASFCPRIVSALARGPWLIAASVAGVTCIVIGRALKRLLSPMGDAVWDEQQDAERLAQLAIARARRTSRSDCG